MVSGCLIIWQNFFFFLCVCVWVILYLLNAAGLGMEEMSGVVGVNWWLVASVRNTFVWL